MSSVPRTLRVVLNGVDTIDWASLARALHDADDDLPAVLRAVASDDEETSDQAFETLMEWISHQGSIYPTTVACIPFLDELADSDERVVRGGEIGLTIWEDELMQHTLNAVRLDLA
jgi:hypothetical protein